MNGLNPVYSPLLGTGCLVRVGSRTVQTSVCEVALMVRALPIDLAPPIDGVPPIVLALTALTRGALEKKG